MALPHSTPAGSLARTHWVNHRSHHPCIMHCPLQRLRCCLAGCESCSPPRAHPARKEDGDHVSVPLSTGQQVPSLRPPCTPTHTRTLSLTTLCHPRPPPPGVVCPDTWAALLAPLAHSPSSQAGASSSDLGSSSFYRSSPPAPPEASSCDAVSEAPQNGPQNGPQHPTSGPSSTEPGSSARVYVPTTYQRPPLPPRAHPRRVATPVFLAL